MTASIALAAMITIGACGSDKTTVDAGGEPASGTKCVAPAADGKPTVLLPKSPASELGIKDDTVGSGPAIEEHATVTVNYIGCGQVSGKQFDSSWDSGQPATFSIDQVIPGWTKGLLGMKVGGRRTLTIPGELAYGATPRDGSGIQPDETLVFVIDLISISPPIATTTTKPADPAVVAAIDKRGKPTVTLPDAPATDLIIVDDVVGTGAEITPGATVTVHYVGVGQLSKQQFDASWDRGLPATFSINQVIPGWTKGLLGMKVGGRRTLTIPGELAYGATPRDGSGIQPDETLVFVVDLVAVA